MPWVPRATVAASAVLLLAFAACRGGVKSGLRAWEREVAAPPAVAPPPPAPLASAPPVRPQVWRIEYYKISDG